MRINALGNTATDFANDDYIVIDGTTNGSRKMAKSSLLKVTKENAIKETISNSFDPSRIEATKYLAGESVVYEDSVYTFLVDHYGAWDSSKVQKVLSLDTKTKDHAKLKSCKSKGFNYTKVSYNFGNRAWGINQKINGFVKRVSAVLNPYSSIDVVFVSKLTKDYKKISTLVNSTSTIKEISVDVDAYINGYIGLSETSGFSVLPLVKRNDGFCNGFAFVYSTLNFEETKNWTPAISIDYYDIEDYIDKQETTYTNIISSNASPSYAINQSFSRAVTLNKSYKGKVKNVSAFVKANSEIAVVVCNDNDFTPYIVLTNSTSSDSWISADCDIKLDDGDFIGIMPFGGTTDVYCQRNNVNGGARFYFTNTGVFINESDVWTIALRCVIESSVKISEENAIEIPKNIIVPIYGQSLSVGADATPQLKSAGIINGNSMNGKVICTSLNMTTLNRYELTLINEYDQETPATGCVLGIFEELSRLTNIPKNSKVWETIKVFAVSCGQGSSSLESLADPDGTLYSGLINAVTRLNTLITDIGETAFIPALVWIQGETNMRYGVTSPSYYADDYKNKLSNLVASINTDFKSITGQLEDIKCVCYQTSSQGYINGQYYQLDWNFVNIPKLSKVPMEQMLAVRDLSNFVASAPAYTIEHNEDVVGKANIHLTNVGSRHLGYFCGSSIANIIYGKNQKCGILPISYNVVGNDITIKFLVENGTLTTDSSFVKRISNYGFSVMTSGNIDIITSVDIFEDSVEIKCSQSPVGALLSYGCIGTDNYDGKTKGARGNLCSTYYNFVEIENKKIVQKEFCYSFYCVLAAGQNNIE